LYALSYIDIVSSITSLFLKSFISTLRRMNGSGSKQRVRVETRRLALSLLKNIQCIFCSCLTLFKVSWCWTIFSIGLFTTSTTTARLITLTMHSLMAHSWILSSCSPCKLYIVGGCADSEAGESYQQLQHLQVSCNTGFRTVMLICLCTARVRFVCQWDVYRHLCKFLLFLIIYNAWQAIEQSCGYDQAQEI